MHFSQNRKVFIAGNWKCNGDRAFVNKHCMHLSGARIDKNTTELCLAPPNIYLLTCKTFLAHLFHICSQNISQFDNGPYTGEVSAKQIKDLGIDWTIIGNSDRRKFLKEDEIIIGQKIEQALKNKLPQILSHSLLDKTKVIY
jgi:triosephosphate isomerase